jgi:hypothetical protein
MYNKLVNRIPLFVSDVKRKKEKIFRGFSDFQMIIRAAHVCAVRQRLGEGLWRARVDFHSTLPYNANVAIFHPVSTQNIWYQEV